MCCDSYQFGCADLELRRIDKEAGARDARDTWGGSRRDKAKMTAPDFTEDLKKITVPVLVMHGDDDQIVPYADSAPLSAKLLRTGR